MKSIIKFVLPLVLFSSVSAYAVAGATGSSAVAVPTNCSVYTNPTVKTYSACEKSCKPKFAKWVNTKNSPNSCYCCVVEN